MEMGAFEILERFGLPVAMVVALGWYVKAQKGMQMNQVEIKAKIAAIIEIMVSLSGNGLKEKFSKKNNDRGW